MLDPTTALATFFITPFAMIIYFVIFTYFFKLKRNSTEFKILLGLCIYNAIAVFATELSSIVTNVIVYIISAIIAGGSFLVIIFYILKKIIKQKKEISLRTIKIENVLEVSEHTSEKVSNSATSLAASANEINASAEEISDHP